MTTKALTLEKDEVTQADVLAALREFNRGVDVIEKRMAERDKRLDRLSKSSRASMLRIKKMLSK